MICFLVQGQEYQNIYQRLPLKQGGKLPWPALRGGQGHIIELVPSLEIRCQDQGFHACWSPQPIYIQVRFRSCSWIISGMVMSLYSAQILAGNKLQEVHCCVHMHADSQYCNDIPLSGALCSLNSMELPHVSLIVADAEMQAMQGDLCGLRVIGPPISCLGIASDLLFGWFWRSCAQD